MRDDDEPTFEGEMDAVENAPLLRGRDILARCGFVSPPPDSVPQDLIAGRIRELIYAMATRRFFANFTADPFGLKDAD